MFKKSVSLVLALLMLVMVFAACSKEQPEETQDTTAVVTDGEAQTTEPAPEGEQVVLASNGKSDFTIWVANEIFAGYPDVLKQVNDMAALIKNKTGANIAVMSDSSYSVKASKNPGILIGNTKFAESQALNSEMKNKDYHVGMSGNKILIFGGDIDGVSKAVRYFYITVLNSQKVVDKTMVFDTALHTLTQTEKYDINSIKCADTELGKFTIVMPAEANTNESYFAYALRYWLYQKYGYRMNIVTDAVTASDCEVLIGKTDRTEAASLDADEYSVSVKNGKLCLAAGGMLGYNELYSYITGTLLKPGGSVDYTLAADYSHKAEAAVSIDNGSSLLSGKTGQVRMYCNNVFSGIESYDDGTTTGPMALRQALQLEMIRAYAPDVVALQEFSQNLEPFVAMMTDIGYEQVPSNASVRNQNPLFFDNSKLQLVASGYHGYTGIDAQKAASWAVFNVRGTDKSFIAVSTHFMWNSPELTTDQAEDARKLNATELLSLIDDIRDMGYGDLPVIMGGDYNCQLTTDPMVNIKNAGFDCARDVATQKNDSNGYHSYSRYDTSFETYSIINTPNKAHSAAIDHMFVSEGMTVNSFAAVTLPYALYASDHCPMVTDFTIN